MPDCAWWNVPCQVGTMIGRTETYRTIAEQTGAMPDRAAKVAVDAAAATLGVQPQTGLVLPPAGVAPSAPVGTAAAALVCSQQSERTGGTSYWRDVQRKLCNAGSDPGRIDGRVGTNTRSGIEAFQRRLGLPVTGRIDGATAAALAVSPESAAAAPGGAAAPGAPTDEVPERPSGITEYISLTSPVFWGGLLVLGGLGVAGYMWLRRRKRAAFMAKPLGPEAQLPAGSAGSMLPRSSSAASATANRRRGKKKGRKRGGRRRR